MDWIAVESSQISHLGYEPEAEYPLGVKFHPSKKQQAAGQPGSVYEYANVGASLFAAFVAADSVEKFFEAHIKAYPDQFPYRKAETAVDLGPVKSAGDDERGLF